MAKKIIVNKPKKAIINKHINGLSQLPEGVTDIKDMFVDDMIKSKGEIVICNDENDPSIYIMNNNGEVVKVPCNSNDSESGYDDTAIWSQVNKNLGEINDLKEQIGNLDDNFITDITDKVNEVKNTIDEYTINSKKISESPILKTNDLTIDESYSILNNPETQFISKGTILTNAIFHLEETLSNTTLVLTSAINDLEKRIGSPTEFNEDGTISKLPTGLYAKYEELKEQIQK